MLSKRKKVAKKKHRKKQKRMKLKMKLLRQGVKPQAPLAAKGERESST